MEFPSHLQGGVPGAPPPPPEVKVRTMRSDLDSMAKSGGGLPRFQNVQVSGLAVEQGSQGSPTAATSFPASVTATPNVVPADDAKSKSPIGLIAVVIVALIALGVVGYFAYGVFSKKGTATPTTSTTSNTASSSTTSQSGTTSSSTSASSTSITMSQSSYPATSFELNTAHVSLFKHPADQILNVNFGSINPSSTTTLQTYSQKMAGFLAVAQPFSTFIEVSPTFSDNNSVSIEGLLSQAGVVLIDPTVLQKEFNPDATFFVYRDKNGFWPGYVLSLASGQSLSSVSNDIKGMETAKNIEGLFLTNAGVPSSNAFVDATIANTPVRILPFTGIPPAYFVYGWDQNYLVISTSQNGFAAAVTHLQP